jgi:pimeloyl-ACP methyl ester carboxylesterase
LALEDESMKQAMAAVCFLAIGASFLNKNPLTPYTALMIGRKLYNAKEFKVVWDQISGLNRDDKAVISDLDCPTIISYGREEMIQPLHTIEELFDRDSAKIVKFNTGHSILFEAKEQYLGLLEEFYNELAD